MPATRDGMVGGTRNRVADVTMSHVRHSLHSLLAHVHRVTYIEGLAMCLAKKFEFLLSDERRTNIQHYGGHFSMTTLSSVAVCRVTAEIFVFFFFFAK